jgi:hypothetical protein
MIDVYLNSKPNPRLEIVGSIFAILSSLHITFIIVSQRLVVSTMLFTHEFNQESVPNPFAGNLKLKFFCLQLYVSKANKPSGCCSRNWKAVPSANLYPPGTAHGFPP